MKQLRLYFEASEEAIKAINAILDPLFEDAGHPISIFRTVEEMPDWTFSIYIPEEEVDNATTIISSWMKKLNISASIHHETLESEGWVEKTLSDLKPVRAERFVVHGSHDKGCAKFNEISIEIDAGLAFGTGHHGTTAGCLEMIFQELKYKRPKNALDMGAGTGVLAIAIAKALKIPVLASDIDPVAEQVARQNAKINLCQGFLKCITAKGFSNPEFLSWNKFDFAVANILAGPLQKMALDFSKNLRPNATLILSGLLPHQKARIVAAYRIQGLSLKRAHILDGWLTLVLKKH